MAEKKRTPNFTANEKDIFLNLITIHKDLVESKKTDAVSRQEKEKAWDELTNDFNASSTFCPRSKSALQGLWGNLKKKARIAAGKEKTEIFKTGGGSFDPAKLPNSVDTEVLKLIGPSGTGLTNFYDSDADFICDRNEQATSEPILVDDGVVTLDLEEELLGDMLITADDGTAMFEESAPSKTDHTHNNNWSEYVPRMLMEKKHPALKFAVKKPVVINRSDAKSKENEEVPNSQNNNEDFSNVSPNTPTERNCLENRATNLKRRRPVLPNSAAENLIAAKIRLIEKNEKEMEEESKRKGEMHALEKDKKIFEIELLKVQLAKALQESV